MGSSEIFIYRYFQILADKLDYFIPASFRKDVDELRRCRMMTGAALSVGFLTLGLSFARLLTEGWDSSLGWIFAAVAILLLSSPLILRLSKSILFAGSMIPTIGASTLIFMAVFEGGLESEAIYWFPFAPLIAAFFVNAFASIIFGLLMLIALTAIYFAQQSGMIIPSSLPVETMQFLKLMSATAAVVFGASIAWLYETNRHKSEDALHRSNAKTEAIVSAIPDAMFLLNPKGKILKIKTTTGIGILNSLIQGRKYNTIMDLFSIQDKERLTTQLQRAINAGTIQMEEYELDKAGQHLSLEVRIVPTNTEEVLAIIRDVTSERNVERLKNEFLSTVSHELRTPLTAIVGYIGLLSAGVIPGIPKQANEMIENTNRNAERLSILIDDLLDLQKISSGQIQYNMKIIQLDKFIKQSIELNQGYASKYNVKLTCDKLIDTTNIRIDESRMHQVMANLISNAIKFSPTGEEVLVQLQHDSTQVIISVTDKGPGIPEEFCKHVFDKFTQSDSSNTRESSGTGLGLSITKIIVEAHGGYINFETEQGIGTTFNIYLPIKHISV
ncbi:MAG: ATP-binding protein [Gammaproteobacteria bacterium]|nr:ATP-binding protein [Gammaproteobacteria bacterium]